MLTAWILWGPVLPFGVYSPRGHLVLNTVDVCVALLAAYLAHLRFARARRVSDLLLAQSLFTLALSGALGLLLAGRAGTTEIWLPMTMRVAAAGLLLAAAAVGPGHTVAARGCRRWTALAPVGLLLVGSLTAWWLGPMLPVAMETGEHHHVDPVQPELLTAHPVLIGAYLFSALCLLLASYLFTVRALRTGDELLRWLGPACALGGFARVAYAVTPTLYTSWFYTGDLLRTGFYLLLLIGSARELAQHWTSRTAAAVAEDRRRLARELHDGVIQELAYIRVEAHQIVEDEGLEQRILGATDRAIDEARTAIHALGTLDGEPLPVMLRRAAAELSRRHKVRIEVEADEGIEVGPDQLHTLLRIAREAITNAARHGGAAQIRIELHDGEQGRLLTVRDDGTGFDPEEAMRTMGGYGLVSMGERARSLPGTLRVDSTPGAGSEVQVRW